MAISSIRNEFGGKVEGAMKLAPASSVAPLSCFNLFSSLAAFSGSGGQAGYAAANGALDSQAMALQAIHLSTSARLGNGNVIWSCFVTDRNQFFEVARK